MGNHTLAWDAAEDWDTDLGQVKFEILAMDGRGLLPIDWITIPAANGNPALTISKDTPADAAVLNALFWQYADGDSGLTLNNGILTGNSVSGVFDNEMLASGNAVQLYSIPYILKRMNLDPASASEVNYSSLIARAGILATNKWHIADRSYMGISKVIASGYESDGNRTIPTGLTDVVEVSTGQYVSVALQGNGTVVSWGYPDYTNVPVGLSDVTAISAGAAHGMALKSDETVVVWGDGRAGQLAVPAGLTGVIAISAGNLQCAALKSDGTIVEWGTIANYSGNESFIPMPSGLTEVKAISAGTYHNLALKNDGTVVGWGYNTFGGLNIPAGLGDVTAIASGWYHALALKSDGTVVAWGAAGAQTIVPSGLNGVVAIAAGAQHSLALKNDGTVVSWGTPASSGGDFLPFPVGLTGVNSIAAGTRQSLALKLKTP